LQSTRLSCTSSLLRQMKLFGKAQRAPAPKDAIAKLRETLDMLQKREDYLQTKVQKELLVAKQNATKNKRTALAALKRKRAYESQIDKMQGARTTIETQVIAIENMTVALEAMSAMKTGAKAMASIHNHMKVEDVDDTMEEIREQMDMANEINDAIAQPIGEQFDEEELEEELRKLEEENLEEKFLEAPAEPANKLATQLPTVPSGTPAVPAASSKTAVKSDDDEFRALEASMT